MNRNIELEDISGGSLYYTRRNYCFGTDGDLILTEPNNIWLVQEHETGCWIDKDGNSYVDALIPDSNGVLRRTWEYLCPYSKEQAKTIDKKFNNPRTNPARFVHECDLKHLNNLTII